ncbi:MAG: guanylate kinase [Gemmatimonadales bacterium]
MSRRACPVVLAAPSGTGKTTLAHRLVGESTDYVFSISATTRMARVGEIDGVDYHFVDRRRFEEMVAQDELVEWAEVHGRLYGTPRAELERAAARGVHVVLDIDVQGARQIKARIPEAKLIFVLPPDVDTLLGRLTGRGTEDRADVARRLASALRELQVVEEFDYVVVNDDLERCVETIRGIVSGNDEGRAHGGTVASADPRAVGLAVRLRREIGRILDENYAEYTNVNP